MPMGFDIECIIDIHNYPGEYFCPVCRTLVYPNEAVQSQCTHLYCKACLSHVANGTKACPYDGYLVTESESKPLVESDKTLVENIGKVKVHCLFFRSGCTWEGTLSECNSHCSACSFGNSPVICNRCGVQIVHRQVHEHAQSCPGGYVAHQAASGVVGTTGSSTTTATTSAEITPTVTQAAAPLTQAQNTQTVPLATPMPGQNNQPPLFSGAVPTPEQQWYQQQYQQYYQQYAGYQLYQQPPQQYNPLQQQAYQQYQQHPVPVQAQNQSNVHPQAAPQPQLQNLTHLVPQTQLQPQQQAQLQPQQQAQLQPQQQSQPQAQVPPSVPNYQVNHQLSYPPMRAQAPIPLQTIPSSSAGQVAPYPQSMGMRPAAQHAQVPHYQQPQASQAHIQPQMHPQPLSQHPPFPLPSNQSHVQIQQSQSYHIQPQTYPPPPQPIQANGPASLPQGPHPPVPPASGHHSYPQPQATTQQMQAGFPQQHPGHPHASSGSLNPFQAPHQPLMMHPPPSFGSLSQQQSSTMMPLQSQVPGIPPPLAQQPPRSFQHRPVMQPSQQTVTQQYAQQQPFHAPFHDQSHQQGHFMQQSVQPPRAYGHLQSQRHQNYMGRPVEPNLGMHPQTIPQSFGDTNPIQLSSNQPSVNQNNVESTTLEQNTMKQTPRSSSNRPVETGFEQDSVKKEATVGQNETVQSGGNAANGLSSIKQEVGLDSSLEQTSGGKLSEVGMQDDRKSREDNNLLKNGDTMKQEDHENQDMKVSKVVVGGMSSTNSDKQSHMAVSGSTYEGNKVPSKSHSSFQQKPQSQFPAHSPPSIPGPKGPGWREPGYFGPPPNNFGSHSSNQRPPMNTSVDPHGFIGRAPRPHFEGQFGPQHPARPSGNATFRDQRSVDGGPVAQIYNNEPSFVRVNGGTAPDSCMFDLSDEKEKTFVREHFDPFSVESTQPLNRSLGYTGNASRGQNYDAASKLDSAALGPHSRFPPSHHSSVGHSRMGNFGPGPEFGQHHMKHFGPRSPERVFRGFGGSIFPRGHSFADIIGREAHGFGEGSISFNPTTEFGNPFHDGRFPPSSGLLQRGNIDGPGNLKFGDHMDPRPLNNHDMRDEVFGPDDPSHLMRKDFRGPGNFSGQFNTAETAGPGAFSGRTPMAEYGTGSGMRNSYSGQGLPNAATFEGGPDPFDLSRKRRPMSTGWCRICKVDCETVEGLDMHSQTREHQKMAMDMVKTIKQQNKKKQRTSGVHNSHDGRARKVCPEYHGNKR